MFTAITSWILNLLYFIYSCQMSNVKCSYHSIGKFAGAPPRLASTRENEGAITFISGK